MSEIILKDFENSQDSPEIIFIILKGVSIIIIPKEGLSKGVLHEQSILNIFTKRVA